MTRPTYHVRSDPFDAWRTAIGRHGCAAFEMRMPSLAVAGARSRDAVVCEQREKDRGMHMAIVFGDAYRGDCA